MKHSPERISNKLRQERQRWLVERRRQAQILLGDEQFQATVRQLLEQAPAPGSLPF